MRTYELTLTGKMPLLMHADNIAWSDVMDEWKKKPANKENSKAGDDRSPAYRWLGSLYHDGTHITIPTDNLSRAFMEAGAMVPTGKGTTTFRSRTQSGMLLDGAGWPLLLNGQPVPYAPLRALETERSFAAHQRTVEQAGFSLFLKRAKVNQSKHIRVRPQFEKWSVVGSVAVWEDAITEEVLRQIVTLAGLYKGLGDWRPGGKTPGPYGTFAATVRSAS